MVKPEYLLLLGSDAIKAVHGKNVTLEKTRSHVYVLASVKDMGTGNIKDASLCSPEEYSPGIKVLGDHLSRGNLERAGLPSRFRGRSYHLPRPDQERQGWQSHARGGLRLQDRHLL